MNKSPREAAEAREKLILSSFAAHSSSHLGREIKEAPCPVRTAFQRDCHRIAHSKAFRRLKGKTQVFLWPEGDHYRTRLTHCLEVSQIARTICRALNLNEDLAEAISLGHDLGHTPFGHAGEETLQKLVPGGFRHEEQSLRVVEHLENKKKGLNLTAEVRDGILKHSKGAGPILDVPVNKLPRTLEGQAVRFADVIAYANHDLDDAVRAKVINEDKLPQEIIKELGNTHSARITTLVLDVVNSTSLKNNPKIEMSHKISALLTELRSFLYKKVYYNNLVHLEFKKANTLLNHLWDYFTSDMDRFYKEIRPEIIKDKDPLNDIKDFLSGMTDAFAMNLHNSLFTPKRWYIY